MFPLAFIVLAAAIGEGDSCSRGLLVADRTATGPSLRSFTVGDFDEDGRNDIVAADNRQFHRFLNRGRVFAYEPDVSAPGAMLRLYATDVTGDGHLDVVMPADDWVFVARGAGEGTFPTSQKSTLRPSDEHFVGDLDGDGRLDHVGVNQGLLALNLGQADGTYVERATVAVHTHIWPWNTVRFAVGDFDGDGRADVATLGDPYLSSTWHVQFYWNEGNLQFKASEFFPVETPASPLMTADLDGDGVSEVVVRLHGSISIFRGRERKPSRETIPYTGALEAFSPADVADIDADGHRDLVLSGRDGTAILWGPIPGARTVHPSAFAFGAGRIADMDGDRALDLVGLTGDAVVVAHGRRGTREFDAPPLTPLPKEGPGRLLKADLNADGIIDIVANPSGWGKSWALGGDGEGHLPMRAELAGGARAAADFDGDGHVDVAAVINAQGGRVLFGKSDWSFTPGAELAAEHILGPVLMPTKNALVARVGTALQLVSISSGRNVTIEPLTTLSSANDSVSVVDADGDGDSDVLIATALGGRFLLQESGGWREKAVGIYAGSSLIEFIAADLNRDGLPDFVSQSDDINVLLARQDGTYAAAPHGKRWIFVKSVDVADMDGDGFLDLVIASEGNSQDPAVLQIQRNDGSGAFEPYGTWVNDDAAPIRTGDYDGDGHDDVALFAIGGVSVVRNVCEPSLIRAAAIPAVVEAAERVTLLVHSSADLIEGDLEIRLGETLLYSGHLQNDNATIVLPALPAGTHSLTLEYVNEYIAPATTTVRVRVLPGGRRRSVR